MPQRTTVVSLIEAVVGSNHVDQGYRATSFSVWCENQLLESKGL